MADNIYTMTPGSAVAGQLQEILTTKRIEARQAMLDSLNAENVRSEIKAREENAETNKLYRDSLAQNKLSQETSRRAGFYSPNMNLAPADTEFFKKNAPSLVDPGQPASQPFDYEGQPEIPATPDKFHGLPEQLHNIEKQKVMEAAKAKMLEPGFDQLPTALQAYWYEQATNHQPAAGIINPKEPDSQVPIYGADGQPTGNWAPHNAKFLQREPAAPRVPDPAPIQMEATGPDGEKVPVLVDHRGSIIPFSHVPDGLTMSVKPRGSLPKPPSVSTATWRLWTDVLDKVKRSPGDQRLEDDLNNQATRISQELRVDPEISRLVLGAFKDPNNRGRRPTFHDGTKEQVDSANKLWSYLTGGFQPTPAQQ